MFGKKDSGGKSGGGWHGTKSTPAPATSNKGQRNVNKSSGSKQSGTQSTKIKK